MIEMLIGIVGKPSAGKSTFLNAACLTDAKIGNYPFTTIEPNIGSGYVRVNCVCQEFNVKDDPKNSVCVDGIRYIPVKLLDVAGLVPDAHKGRGLGNKFLSDLTRADVLIHILDISGELDLEGNEIAEASHDPMDDIEFLTREIDLWFKDILLRKDWEKFTNRIVMEKLNFSEELFKRLSGLSIRRKHITKAVKVSGLDNKSPNDWDDDDILKFASALRSVSKPILIVANKIDKKNSKSNYERIKKELSTPVIASSALAEFFLRNLAEEGIIDYFPGQSEFIVKKPDGLTEIQKTTLKNIQERILDPFGNTGVQHALNFAVFDLLNNIVVYPVNDEKRLADKDGRVLPDAYVVEDKSNIKDFIARKIHTDLADNFIYAIDARTKMKLGKEYELKNNDVIKVVSAAKS